MRNVVPCTDIAAIPSPVPSKIWVDRLLASECVPATLPRPFKARRIHPSELGNRVAPNGVHLDLFCRPTSAVSVSEFTRAHNRPQHAPVQFEEQHDAHERCGRCACHRTDER
jgi:hypothetical protein